jgi:hypothetical protein
MGHIRVVLVFSLKITVVSYIEFYRAQFSHRIVPRQDVNQFTSTNLVAFSFGMN